MNRDEMAEFLRTRRARVSPKDVGLPEGARRRTPGLRRQEVAQLAGMSVDYYIRLEQGRGPHPSRQVLGRALMLTVDERDGTLHLITFVTPPLPQGSGFSFGRKRPPGGQALPAARRLKTG